MLNMIQVLEPAGHELDLHAAWKCRICGRRIGMAQAVCPARDPVDPKCCGQEMHIVFSQEALHTRGSGDTKDAWGCRACGHFIR